MRRMAVPRELIEGATEEAELELPGEVSHYVLHVLRMSTGDQVELFDGTGLIVRGTLLRTGPPLLRVDETLKTEAGESPLFAVLFQAIPKGKRWDTVLEKATELGVRAIVPLETKRTIVQVEKKKAASKVERWEKMVAAAARQSMRSLTPEIFAPLPIEEALLKYSDLVHFVAHTKGEGRRSLLGSVKEHWSEEKKGIGIWIGPEGGFTEQEVHKLEKAGALFFHLGPRILRADTAGLSALTAIQLLCGDLGDEPL